MKIILTNNSYSNIFVHIKKTRDIMRRSVYFILHVSLLILAVSCVDNHYKIKTRPDIPEPEIQRLEKDLFMTDPAFLPGIKDSLLSKYGNFIQLFAYVIGAGDLADSMSFDNMVSFVTDRDNYDVFRAVNEKYPDMDFYEKEFRKAWANYNYYFPDSCIPAMYTFISGFNNSLIVGDSVLGIGLDRYLGPESGYYSEMGIYRYLSYKMSSWKLVPDAMYGWASACCPYSGDISSDDLLSRMLYEGKLLYFTKCMLYDYPDSVLFGFTADQVRFCEDNESQMWQYIIEHDLLYSTDLMIIRKMTGEAPFTAYFTSESPGRAAVWVGFRIVESYMRNKPDVELYELMREENYRKILEEARYNPSK